MFTPLKPAFRLINHVAFSITLTRHVSSTVSYGVTKQLTFYTNDELRSNSSASSESNNDGGDRRRPVVVIYGWLLSTNKALKKFADHYVGRGCDVLTVKTSPTQFMWPSRARKIIDDLFHFADGERMRSRPIIVHTFSVGGYMYGETLLRGSTTSSRRNNNEKTLGASKPFKNRIVGQIIDSPIDFAGVPNGLALTLFPAHRSLQWLMKSIFYVYLYASYPFTMRRYVAASRAFHEAPALVPALWFYSLVDDFMSPEDIEKVIGKWQAMGVDCTKMCWRDSPHILHFKRNSEEYSRLVDQFLDRIRQSEKTR